MVEVKVVQIAVPWKLCLLHSSQKVVLLTDCDFVLQDSHYEVHIRRLLDLGLMDDLSTSVAQVAKTQGFSIETHVFNAGSQCILHYLS